MQTRPIERVSLAKLTYSGLNVRAAADLSDDAGIETLAASIDSVGLLAPLVVGKAKRKGASHPIYAGRRRFTALKSLVIAGKLDADAEIPVVIVETESEATEVSLAENYAREQMTPVQVYDAFRVLKSQRPDATLEQLGAPFGYDAQRTARIMRLANLAHPVMEAYRAAEISDAQAMAFASTEDHDAQARVLTAIGKAKWDNEKTPAVIRRLLGAMSIDTAAMLSLVGVEVYRAAGGRFEEDLFVTGTAGILQDEDLLKRLYREEVDRWQDRFLRRLKRNGRMFKTDGAWGPGALEVEFVDQAPQKKEYGYLSTDYDLQIKNAKVEPAGADWRDPDTIVVLPKKGAVVITTALKAGPEGGAYLDFTLWYRDKSAKGVPDKGSKGTAAPTTKTAAQKEREGYGLTKDGIGAMLVVHRDIMRDQLMYDQELAYDWLIFTQARTIFTPTPGYPGSNTVHYSGAACGVVTLEPEDACSMKPPASTKRQAELVTRAPALAEAMAEIGGNGCFTHPDPVEGFNLFRSRDTRFKGKAMAIVAGWTMRGADSYYGDPQMPRLVQALAADHVGTNAMIGDSVTYDERFFSLINAKGRARILEQWGQGEALKRLKGSETAAHCAKVYAAATDSFVEGDAELAKKLLGLTEDDMADIRTWKPEWWDVSRPAPLKAPQTTLDDEDLQHDEREQEEEEA